MRTRSTVHGALLAPLALLAFLALLGPLALFPADARAERAPAVRVWEGTLDLPTTVEGPPNPNPPFDLMALDRFNYPYTLRDALTDRERVERYRALFMENEFLKITVLPELGGHLYSCVDKVSGREMFYANRSIKKALIGYRGAWAAFGIEFNFPVSHNWMSLSPVDDAVVANADGSASIWVSNVDAVFGSQWRVELRLRPGRAVLEQHTTLVNQGSARHRYYWWTNAAVEVHDDSHLVYPTHLMATHGFTAVVPWPIDARGRDLSLIRNQTAGPVSLFTYGTREAFIGVWHPSSRSGTVHLAPVSELPTSKVWSWGADREAMEWRHALSDDQSAYIELQAGLFRNQETYALLGPQEQVRFSEYWIPARDIGGITRATVDAVFHADRRGDRVAFELSATRRIAGARLRVRQGDRVLFDRVDTLSPRATWREDVLAPKTGGPWTFELRNAQGTALMSHTEDHYDALSGSEVDIGPRPLHRYPTSAARTEGDVVQLGHDEELNGRRLQALSTYVDGLSRFPASVELNLAAGRLATSLGWVEARATRAIEAGPIGWLTKAYARDTTDMETRYYLGLAEAALGQDRAAVGHFEAAQRFSPMQAAARLQLARLAARRGDLADALEWLAALVRQAPDDVLGGATEVACLRRAMRLQRARSALDKWRRIDPTSNLLRYEAVRLGATDPDLWQHLGADSMRVLDLVDQYLAIGAFDDALDVLNRRYPIVAGPAAEPGAVPPSRNPLVAYYRGYVKAQLGRSGVEDYRAASALPLTYVFPSRHSTYAVLGAALAVNPVDAAALALRGALHLSSGLVEEAVADWNQARAVKPDTPTLDRNLGLTLLQVGRLGEAVTVLREGTAHDARNVDVYLALDQALSASAAPVSQRVEALERYPDPAHLPQSLVYALALAKGERGDQDAEALFRDRYFPREEGGTSPGRVLVGVRVARSRSAAVAGHCDLALTAVDEVGRPDAGMPFTAGALEASALDPLVQLQLARVEQTCGRTDRARRRWESLSGPLSADAGPLRLTVDYEAATALGTAKPDEWTGRLEAALSSVIATLETGDASAPSTLTYVRARLLAALGRTAQARESLTRVFQYGDSNLSHLFARFLRDDLEEHRQ